MNSFQHMIKIILIFSYCTLVLISPGRTRIIIEYNDHNNDNDGEEGKWYIYWTMIMS